MRSRGRVVAGWLALGLVGSLCAQSGNNPAAARETVRATAGTGVTAQTSHGVVLREIDDPATGDRWLLLRNPDQPAAPGRLVLAGRRIGPRIVSGEITDNNSPAPPSAHEEPVIHTGDALTVEEHTPVVDARLEAVALGSAVKGETFRARLKIGGKVVRVIAAAPGHAVFCPESEAGP